MDDHREEPAPSRRSFLKAGAWAAGALIAAPNLDIASVAAATTTRRVGVLLPATGRTPQLAASIQAGLQLALAERQQLAAVELVAGSYGAQRSPRTAAQQLVAGGAELIVGLLSTTLAAQLRPIVDERGTALLALSCGEDVVRPAAEVR